MNNLCHKCNQPLTLYKGLWCPRCSRPKELKNKVDYYNLIMVLDWCEEREYGLKERIWTKLLEKDLIHNNSFVRIDFEKMSETGDSDAQFIIDYFGNSDLFEIEW